MELFIGGGAILIYLGLALACLLWAQSWARKRGFGPGVKGLTTLGVLLITYAIPLGDHTIGLIRFKLICNEKAGARIFRTVDGVDGILWGKGQRNKPYSTYGYNYHETHGEGSEVFRYVRREDGDIIEEKDSSPKARFLIRRNPNVQISAHFKRSDFEILERSTGQTLAIHSVLHYEGGWLIRALRGVGVSGAVCPEEPFDSLEFIHSVLVPSRSVE